MDGLTRSTDVPAGILVAELIHDTAANDRPAGVRLAARDRTRRLLFAVGEVELMVQVSAHEGDVDVAGQVAVGDVPLVGVPVGLEAAGERRAGVTERGGGFWFPAPAGAVCRLIFDGHGYEIRTAPFRADVGEAAAEGR